jgi:drug/metabolite transporter (DMT)-like permease
MATPVTLIWRAITRMRWPRGEAVPVTQDARKAVLIMVLGIALFSILNGAVKDQARIFPVNQIVFFRNALGLPPLIAIVLLSGGLHRLRMHNTRRHVTHAVTMTASLMLAFVGFRLMPLAEANAISFLRPLIVVALAAPLLGEKVTALSWFAVLTGFAGVLVIMQPGAGVVELGALYSLAAAFVGAVNMVQQRSMSLTDHTIGIVFWYMAISSALLLPSLAFFWVQPTGPQLAGLIAMGVASGICQYLMIRPLVYAGASTLAPVQYTGLLWSIIVGYVWFGDVPTPAVLLGAAIVVASTLLVLHGGGKRR